MPKEPGNVNGSYNLLHTFRRSYGLTFSPGIVLARTSRFGFNPTDVKGMCCMRNLNNQCANSDLRPTANIQGPRLVAGLLALLCAVWLAEGGTPARAGERQTLHGHVPAAVGYLRALEQLASTNRLDLVIGLPLRNREALASLLGQLYEIGRA